MFDFIHQLPMWTAKLGGMIIFSIVLVSAWVLPKDFIMKGAPDTRRRRDLRIWATILIALQLALYAVF